jgi:simple sugar transport system ATP-binding protein
VVANSDVSLDLHAGVVHCLLGENGAGKSTLIGILAGMQQPDEGWIEIDGVRIAIPNPRTAVDQGIGVVYQHSTLIPTMTVLENLMLGDTDRLRQDRKGALARLEEISSLLGSDIDPDSRAEALGLGQQQQVEIAKAMWRGSRLLILDEPTSMLTPQAVANLQDTVARLKEDGLAVIFITHKLREAYAMGDEISVLRRGVVVHRISRTELAGLDEQSTRVRVLAAMFGDEGETEESHAAAELLAGESKGRTAFAPSVGGPVVLSVESASTVATTSDMPIEAITFDVRAGEILGVAGIDGHGQSALAEAIAGQRSLSSGRIELSGLDVTEQGVRSRQKLGLRYVTDDRLHEGIVGSLSVALNLMLKQIGSAPYWRGGRIQRAQVAAEAERLVEEYEIRTPAVTTRAGTLSGGNIQKLLLARELSHEPKVVVFHKPTYGLDLRTVGRVRDLIRGFVADGGSALLISTDLDELVEMSDRIVVLSRGQLVGEVVNDGVNTAERIGVLMTAGTTQGSARE